MGLRNAGNISKATCKLIQETASEMGYRPNLLAAALRQGTHKSFTQHGTPLAILQMPLEFNPNQPSKKNGLYPVNPIASGIIRRANELGYRVETFHIESPRDLMMIRHHERGIPPTREQTVIQTPWNEGHTLPYR